MFEFLKMNPTFMLLAAGLVLTVGILIFKVGQWASGVDRLQDIVKNIEEKLDDILKRLTGLENRMTGVENRLSILEDHMPKPLTQSQSPVQLTDHGREVSIAVKAKEWAEKYAPKLLKTASGKKEFEIFDLCVNHLEAQYDKDKVFKEAIASGAYEHGVEKDQLQRVFAIELRDKLLGLIEKDRA